LKEQNFIKSGFLDFGLFVYRKIYETRLTNLSEIIKIINTSIINLVVLDSHYREEKRYPRLCTV